jgi:hypothetical protein
MHYCQNHQVRHTTLTDSNPEPRVFRFSWWWWWVPTFQMNILPPSSGSKWLITWRQRQYVPLKHCYPPLRLHGMKTWATTSETELVSKTLQFGKVSYDGQSLLSGVSGDFRTCIKRLTYQTDWHYGTQINLFHSFTKFMFDEHWLAVIEYTIKHYRWVKIFSNYPTENPEHSGRISILHMPWNNTSNHVRIFVSLPYVHKSGQGMTSG